MTAAETVLHGGAGCAPRRLGVHVLRGAGAYSLLETAASRGWQVALALERGADGSGAGDRHVARPQPAPPHGPLPRLPLRRRRHGHSRPLAAATARAPARRAAARGSCRASAREVTAHGRVRRAALSGARGGAPPWDRPPRCARAREPLDATRGRACPGSTTISRASGSIRSPWPPSRSVSRSGSGATPFPMRDGGTAIVLHRLSRHFAHATQDPYRALFHELREGRNPLELRAAERAAAADAARSRPTASGRAPHPLLPYVDWESCRPALDRLGSVVVAGCRDHAAGRRFARVRRARDGTRPRGGAADRLLLGPPYSARSRRGRPRSSWACSSACPRARPW